MDKKVHDKLTTFVDRAKKLFPVKMIILYGSYATETQRENSDIDIAIVVDELEGKWLTVNSKLFLLSAEIDNKIEPNLIIRKGNKSEFLESILKYGKILYTSDAVV